MKIIVAVDVNPIISALLGGFAREIFFRHDFDFVTTEFTLIEVEKYLPYISKKSGKSEKFLRSLLALLPLGVYSSSKYSQFLSNAEKLIQDKKDRDILALALAMNCPLWSNDQHFEEIIEIRLVKTKDFV